MLQLIRRLLGRTKPQPPPFNFERNRYKAKKQWPPNFTDLTHRQQFRYERKWKRRLLLKSYKPQWQKWTKIVQWSLISFVVVYSVFFYDFAKDPMNPRPGEQPFKGLRERMWKLYDGLWTHNTITPERGQNLRRPAGEGLEEPEREPDGQQRIGRS